MKRGLLLAVAATTLCAEDRFRFQVSQVAEVTAELDLKSPDSDWAVKGREAAVAIVRLDGKSEQQVFVHGDIDPIKYRVFLGRLTPGQHEIVIRRDERQSAPQSSLQVRGVSFREIAASAPEYLALAHAPVLFARKNTVGLFSDVPLLVYCQKLKEDGKPVLQYTVIFSNEDGGTSTRALMARWGRTTDIEYVYRVLLNEDGSSAGAIVQGRGHKDIEFKGEFQEAHPLLMPITDNNMIGEATGSPLRFQIVPIVVDLADRTRESIMDDDVFTFRVMAKELEREGKLRPFGVVAGEKISDVRNYLYVDYKANYSTAAFAVQVLLKDGRAFASDLGRNEYAVGRSEWIRTAIELPPETRVPDIANIAFQCIVPPPQVKGEKMADSGTCRLEKINKAFQLDRDYRPGLPLLQLAKPVSVPTGQAVLLKP